MAVDRSVRRQAAKGEAPVNWYYARGDEQVGPLDDQEFRELINAGIIRGDTLVWRPGLEDWLPYEAHIAAPPAAAPRDAAPTGELEYPEEGEQRACASCGRVFPASEMLEYQGDHVCAACKPSYFQAVREGLPMQAVRYAGFWIRFVAVFVDGVLLNVVYFFIGMVSGFVFFSQSIDGDLNEELFGTFVVLMYVFQYLLHIAYETFFIGRFGATPGKMLCKIRVVRADGGRVTYLRAFARYWAKMLSGLILLIGYIMAAFDSEKRTLHDHICDTRVVQ